MAFLSVFLLARAAISKFRFAPISLADFSIVATFLGVMSAALWSVNSREVIQWSISLYLTPLIMYFFAKNLVQDKETLHKVLLAVTLFGFAAALYAIYEQTTGHILFLPKGQSAEGLRTSYTENLRQIRGLLGKPGEFGRVFTASIPVTFYLFFESKAIKGKLLLVGMLVIQAYGIFLTYNRTSWYALLFSLFILQLFYPQFRKMFFIIVFVAVVALWATWDQVNESAVVEERLNEKTENFNGRTPRWEAGMNMWKAKPIRGWGFGWYQRESGRFRTDGDPRNFRSIESDYLHILVGSGLIGFVPYLLFLVVPLINSLRLFFRARAPDWPGSVKPETIAVYWCIIISFAMGSYTQILTQPIVKMLLAITAGAIVGSHEYLLYRSKTKVSSIAELPATVLPGK
jgi:O-antigen ligase